MYFSISIEIPTGDSYTRGMYFEWTFKQNNYNQSGTMWIHLPGSRLPVKMWYSWSIVWPRQISVDIINVLFVSIFCSRASVYDA
jgi:hypothetical protein